MGVIQETQSTETAMHEESNPLINLPYKRVHVMEILGFKFEERLL